MDASISSNLLIQTAMALFEFEQALASYVTDVARDPENLPSSIRDDIIQRSRERREDSFAFDESRLSRRANAAVARFARDNSLCVDAARS
jgi:hypothetical protein